MKELKLIEAHLRDLKECGMDIECECSCEIEDENGIEDENDEKEFVSEFDMPMNGEEPEDEEELENAPKYFESYKRIFKEDEVCQDPLQYSPSKQQCFTKDGKPMGKKFKPGYRPDPKSRTGVSKVDPHAMVTGGTKGADDDISLAQHWAGQPKN